MKTIAIIIPTYNEKNNILKLIHELTSAFADTDYKIHVLVIDDNSPDGTADIVRNISKNDFSVFLISRKEKLGLGSAYLEGYKWCIKNNFQYILQMDADLSHPPSTAPTLVLSIENGYDVAIASRYVEHGGVSSWPLHRRFMSFCANFLVKNFLRTNINDNTTGFRAFNNKTIKLLVEYDIHSKGFSYLIESMYLFHLKNLRIQEIPFIFQERNKGKTKLSYFEIIRFLLSIFRILFTGLKKHNK